MDSNHVWQWQRSKERAERRLLEAERERLLKQGPSERLMLRLWCALREKVSRRGRGGRARTERRKPRHV